jgi:hypothetical protein
MFDTDQHTYTPVQADLGLIHCSGRKGSNTTSGMQGSNTFERKSVDSPPCQIRCAGIEFWFEDWHVASTLWGHYDLLFTSTLRLGHIWARANMKLPRHISVSCRNLENIWACSFVNRGRLNMGRIRKGVSTSERELRETHCRHWLWKLVNGTKLEPTPQACFLSGALEPMCRRTVPHVKTAKSEDAMCKTNTNMNTPEFSFQWAQKQDIGL